MVTVHRAFGFHFMIFKNDHRPAHIHVRGAGGEAKIWLGRPKGSNIDWSQGIGRGDLKRIVDEIQREEAKLLASWRRLHG